jgi:uncharacterized protein (TIGR02246 family)
MKVVRLALLLLVLGTPADAQKPTAAPIDTLLAQLVTAFNAHDAAKAASFYTEDAVWMPPDAPMIRGRNNIEAILRESLKRGALFKLSVLESEISGTAAFAAGTFTATVTLPNAAPLVLPA